MGQGIGDLDSGLTIDTLLPLDLLFDPLDLPFLPLELSLLTLDLPVLLILPLDLPLLPLDLLASGRQPHMLSASG